MTALKAKWVVTAEVIPGYTLKEVTRVWEYKAKDVQEDRERTARGELTLFSIYKKAANDYALALQDPELVNVVRLEFMWI